MSLVPIAARCGLQPALALALHQVLLALVLLASACVALPALAQALPNAPSARLHAEAEAPAAAVHVPLAGKNLVPSTVPQPILSYWTTWYVQNYPDNKPLGSSAMGDRQLFSVRTNAKHVIFHRGTYT